MKISLIIPCYNEAENIFPFYELCKNNFGELEKRVEYIFVNDGSSDTTYEEIKRLINQKCANIIGLNFSRNFGKEAAILAGLNRCTGDFVTIIDADLQQHPKYVVQMISFLENNPTYDCVACYQEKRKESVVLTSVKKIFYRLINAISEVNFEENASDFRTFRKNMVKAILELKEYYRFSKGIFSWVGFNTYYMPYEVERRAFGRTSWSFRKLVRYAVDGFAGFSTVPLKIATWVGSISFLLSIIYFIVVLIEKLTQGISISGYATIVCLILLMGGGADDAFRNYWRISCTYIYGGKKKTCIYIKK